MNIADIRDRTLERRHLPSHRHRNRLPPHGRFSPESTIEALAKANRQLNLITGMTRHDVGNKLVLLAGCIDLAREICQDPDLQNILVELETGVASIRSDIEFLRIFQDFGSHSPHWQYLHEILGNLVVPSSLVLQKEHEQIEVYADPGIRKVFSNLLDNTIRHGRNARRVTVSSRKTPEGLVVSWEDNGSGVPADRKEKIFEREIGHNGGLGLYYAREVLALTNAIINENGPDDSGARFEILFPPGTYRKNDGKPGTTKTSTSES